MDEQNWMVQMSEFLAFYGHITLPPESRKQSMLWGEHDNKAILQSGTNKVKMQEFYLMGKCRNFLFFIFHTSFSFANFEFMFAIKAPELSRRGLEHTLNTTKEGAKFYFYPQNLHFHPAGPT